MTIGLACGLLCDGQNLTIRIYNLANAPAETIDRASAVAGLVLGHAGVATIWEYGAPDSQEGRITDVSAAGRPTADTREYLVVRIVTGIPPHAAAASAALRAQDFEDGSLLCGRQPLQIYTG